MTNQKMALEILKNCNYEDLKRIAENMRANKELVPAMSNHNDLSKRTLETILEGELDDFLGYQKFNKSNKLTDNQRNGSYPRSLKTENGNVDIVVPRDRNGEFKSPFLNKNKSITPKIEKTILSLYAKSMTTRDICEHVREIYDGVEISPSFVSNITNKLNEEVREWQNRSLDKTYPIIFLDAIFCKVKENGKIITKAVYNILGINLDGYKELLGMYTGEVESATFWLQVLTDLNNRGVQDILICSIDGLKGFPEAIATIFPKAEIQSCIVHKIRGSLKYVSYKNKKEFASDLKLIYKADNLEMAKNGLEILDKKWGGTYPIVIRSWKNNWKNIGLRQT